MPTSSFHSTAIAKLFAAGAIAALSASVVVSAQQRGQGRGQAPAAGTAQTAPAANARKYVLVGCVSREGAAPARGASPADQHFLITDQRGDKPTIYRIEGDASELAFHVGHTVEVSGPLTAPAAGATGPNAKALTMKVQSLTYVANSCPKK